MSENIILLERDAEFERATAVVKEFFNALAESLRPIVENLVEIIREAAKNAAAVARQIGAALWNLYPNKRVKHLARHGKQKTRKKNASRILKWFKQLARRNR